MRSAINQPKGVQKPHIPLLIGGGGEQVTLKLVAQYGDSCNVSGSLETIQHKFDVLKKHCEAVGRDYERIRRTVTLSCIIGETDEQAEEKAPAVLRGHAAFMASALIESPATLHERLIALSSSHSSVDWIARQARSAMMKLVTMAWVSHTFDDLGKHCLLVDNERAVEYAWEAVSAKIETFAKTAKNPLVAPHIYTCKVQMR